MDLQEFVGRGRRAQAAASSIITQERIRQLVRAVERNEPHIAVLSTGEAIAVALVLNRNDLLPDGYRKVLEAVDRLGAEWTAAALRVQRDGWAP